MATELVRQELDEEEAPKPRLVVKTTLDLPIAQRLGESVLRVSGRVGVNLRWVYAWLRCGQRIDLDHCTDADLDVQVKTVIGIIDSSSEGGSERLAGSYGI